MARDKMSESELPEVSHRPRRSRNRGHCAGSLSMKMKLIFNDQQVLVQLWTLGGLTGGTVGQDQES